MYEHQLFNPDFKVSQKPALSIADRLSDDPAAATSHYDRLHWFVLLGGVMCCISMSIGLQAVQTEAAGCAGLDLRLKVGKWCQQVWTPQSGTSQMYHYLSSS